VEHSTHGCPLVVGLAEEEETAAVGPGGPAVAERRRAEMSIVVVNIVNGVRFRDVDEYWRGTGDGRDENR